MYYAASLVNLNIHYYQIALSNTYKNNTFSFYSTVLLEEAKLLLIVYKTSYK